MLVIGADTPQVTPGLLAGAARRLAAPGIDAVIGAATDGGYWILGLRAPARPFIVGVPMSTPATGFLQLSRLREAGLRVATLTTLTDVDTAADVAEVAGKAPHGRFAAVARGLKQDLRQTCRAGS